MIYFLIIISFLAGSTPFGFIIAKLYKGIDIRQHGSGNSGATNVFRVLGPVPGIIAFIFDFLKGYLPVLIAQVYFKDLNAVYLLVIGLAAISGHIFTPFFGFKGGKGVATGAGAFFALLPVITLLGALVFGLTFAISRYVSLSSLFAVIFIAAMVWVTDKPISFSLFVTLTAILVIYSHRSNIKRLLNGTENKFKK
jgi:glycerol-3-phosphate acyltransferase PlsY